MRLILENIIMAELVKELLTQIYFPKFNLETFINFKNYFILFKCKLT